MEQRKVIPTLYDWAGGKEVLEKLTQIFYGAGLSKSPVPTYHFYRFNQLV
jgi:truncated hemoglobin YjbI